jgi:hypothetical protein
MAFQILDHDRLQDRRESVDLEMEAFLQEVRP